MKKLLWGVIFALTVLMYPAASHALCNQTGTIVRVTVSGLSDPTHFIFMRPLIFNNFIFFGRTTKGRMATSAAAALVGQTKIFIQGDAASCPTTPTFGNRFIGNIRFLILNP